MVIQPAPSTTRSGARIELLAKPALVPNDLRRATTVPRELKAATEIANRRDGRIVLRIQYATEALDLNQERTLRL